MVIYALVSDTSIGYLFLGGVVPGLLLGIGFMVMNTSSRGGATIRSSRRCRCARCRGSRCDAFPALMLPVILLFGIYGGVMTPTEGAAAAAVYALLASSLIYRAVTWKQLYDALLSSAQGDDLRGHADRRRAGLQLCGHDRERPAFGAALSSAGST